MPKHPISPIYNENSKILILGSFPSVKSREEEFFYGHRQNRFWKVLAYVFGSGEPDDAEEKKEFLLTHSIAVWDVIASCDITGSADSSIKNVVANDISTILNNCDIREIYVNGKTAEKLYNKYIKRAVNREAIYLPSTSPANARYSLEDLVAEWQTITTK
ncbi:MAG: DNA-deoxyinosine glycosylase [Eubacteriales bacterium]